MSNLLVSPGKFFQDEIVIRKTAISQILFSIFTVKKIGASLAPVTNKQDPLHIETFKDDV